MSIKLNKKTNLHDIIFQITDLDFYHEKIDLGEDEESIEKYVIRLYGTTKDDKKIFVKIYDFTPYFFVEIPKHWRKRHHKIFINDIKKRVPKEFQNSLKSYSLVNRFKFYKFTNYTSFNFLRLTFYSHNGFRAFERVLRRKIYNYSLSRIAKKYPLYESNIEPMLRFIHIRKIKGSGWIKIPGKKYKHYTLKSSPSNNEINICTRWTNVYPVNDNSITPLIVASYDIECTSGDGSFPQPHRDSDKVIQIGTTFNRYGCSDCFYEHIITLGSCDKIEGADVESYDTEREVLLHPRPPGRHIGIDG